jgi:hypothetical protein
MTRKWSLLAACVLVALAPRASADGGIVGWTSLGPGNTGGIVRAIAAHPTDPNVVFVGSPGGGIWRTTNALSDPPTWSLTTDESVPSLVVSTLDIAPSDPMVLYAGTGESFPNFITEQGRNWENRGAPGAGMLKSIDGGSNWSRLASTTGWEFDTEDRYVNSVAVNSADSNLVLVATNGGIQRSTDGGLNWETSWTGRVTEVHWVTSTRAVAGLGPEDPPEVAADLTCALYSADSGLTWHPSFFVGTPGVTTLTKSAIPGESIIEVESWEDFTRLDWVQIGRNGSWEIHRIDNRGILDQEGKFQKVDSDDPLPPSPFVIRLKDVLGQFHGVGERVVLRISQRTALSVTQDGTRIYAALGAGGGTLWRSDDFGQRFDFVSNPNPWEDDPNSPDQYREWLNVGTPRSQYNNAIWAASRPLPDKDIVVVGGTELLRGLENTDGSWSFERISAGGRFDDGYCADYTTRCVNHADCQLSGGPGGLCKRLSPHVDNQVIVANALYPSPPSVYVGNDGGIQRAEDIFAVHEAVAGGQSSGWTNLANDLGLTQLHAGRTSPDGGWLIGAGQDVDAVIRSPAGGLNDWALWRGTGDSRGGAFRPGPAMNSCDGGSNNGGPCTINADCPEGSCALSVPHATFYNVRNNDLIKIIYSPGGAPVPVESSVIDQWPFLPNPCDPPPGLPCSGSQCDATRRAIALDPSFANNVVVGGRGIFAVLSNVEDDWQMIRGAVNAPGGICSRSILATAVDIGSTVTNLVWAGYDNGRLSRTDGSPTTWLDVAGGTVQGTIPECGVGDVALDCAVSDIHIDPLNSQRVFVAFFGGVHPESLNYYHLSANCSRTLWVTTNGGSCFTSLMGTAPHELPPTAAFAITTHPDDNTRLYVGTDRGVYASDDNGLSWSVNTLFAEHEGPFNVAVRELSWRTTPNYRLVAATYGLGMYETSVVNPPASAMGSEADPAGPVGRRRDGIKSRSQWSGKPSPRTDRASQSSHREIRPRGTLLSAERSAFGADLYTGDLQTGDTVAVGSNAISDLSALAYVPEPSSTLGIASGAIALLVLARLRKRSAS